MYPDEVGFESPLEWRKLKSRSLDRDEGGDKRVILEIEPIKVSFKDGKRLLEPALLNAFTAGDERHGFGEDEVEPSSFAAAHFPRRHRGMESRRVVNHRLPRIRRA